MKLYETINTGNWTKKSTLREDGRRCVVGHSWAIYPRKAIKLGRIYEDLDRAATLLFPDRVKGKVYRAVVNFNDHPDTTVEDVVRVCKVADV